MVGHSLNPEVCSLKQTKNSHASHICTTKTIIFLQKTPPPNQLFGILALMVGLQHDPADGLVQHSQDTVESPSARTVVAVQTNQPGCLQGQRLGQERLLDAQSATYRPSLW